MSKKVSGQVYKVFTKEFPGRGGRKGNTWYSIKLEGDDLYYRCKANNPGQIDGKYVEFEADAFNDKQAEVVSDVKVVEAPKGTASSGSGSTGGGDRQNSILYQSSRKDALLFVQIAIAAGAVKLPAKEANRLDALDKMVDEYTALFFDDINTLGAVARYNGTDEASAETAPANADDDE